MNRTRNSLTALGEILLTIFVSKQQKHRPNKKNGESIVP